MTTRAAPRGLTHRLARDLDAAFPALVSAHVDGIYSGLRRLAPTSADAEDLTQETFLRAYRALCRYDAARISKLRVRPWLWTIAVNLSRSAARRRSRRITETALDAVADPAASDDAEADAIAAAMEGEWARRLAELSDAQRTAVVLRHIADLPYTEIAAITERPVGTVKADVHRAIATLRTMLAAEIEEQR